MNAESTCRRNAQRLRARSSNLAAWAGVPLAGSGCGGVVVAVAGAQSLRVLLTHLSKPSKAREGCSLLGGAKKSKYSDTSHMNEMALKSTKKKRHQSFPGLPSSPSLQEDVSGEQEMCLFDSYLNYLETPTESQEKVKVKKKKHRKGREREKKKKSSILMEKENVVLRAENMNDPIYQKDKRLRDSKHHHSREPNCLGSNKREDCKMLDASFLELLTKKRDKKAKQRHNSACSNGTQGTKDKHYFKTFKAIPKSQSRETPFCFPLSLDPYVNGKGGQKGLSQSETPGPQVPCKSEALDSVHSFTGSTIKGLQQNRKLHKEVLHGASINEISSYASTESLLFSTPKALEIKTSDSEEELDMGDREEIRPSQMSSDPEAISSGIVSQELFITQQSLFPRPVHSSSSPLHPSSNAKEAVLERSYSNSNSSSAAKETFENSFLLTLCSLTPSKRREHFSATRECGIQTDDFFSSSAVASSFIIKKSIDCHEQPLDLSLPYRIRSGAPSAKMSNSLEGAGDGIPVSPRSKLKRAIKVLNEESESLMGSQSQKSDDIKYIQLYLNSSYYFKLKGDTDTTVVSGTPLVKLRSPDATVSGTLKGKLTLEKRKRKNRADKRNMKRPDGCSPI